MCKQSQMKGQLNNPVNRRKVLRTSLTGAGAMGANLMLPTLFQNSVAAATAEATANGKILVVRGPHIIGTYQQKNGFLCQYQALEKSSDY